MTFLDADSYELLHSMNFSGSVFVHDVYLYNTLPDGVMQIFDLNTFMIVSTHDVKSIRPAIITVTD